VAALGLEPVPIPVDDEGPTVDGLRRAIRAGIAAVVVTSRAQNPTGASVTAARASRLRQELAAATEVLVIEDDHAAELAGEPLAPLAGPGSPVGADPVGLQAVRSGPAGRRRRRGPGEHRPGRGPHAARLGWVSTLLQRLVVEIWRDPSVAAAVAAARDEYVRRREALLAALGRRGVAARGATGINVWVSTEDEAAAVATLRDLGGPSRRARSTAWPARPDCGSPSAASICPMWIVWPTRWRRPCRPHRHRAGCPASGAAAA
jgi:hypothetical protein